jgi:exodeoxyribonuclease VII large subunit
MLSPLAVLNRGYSVTYKTDGSVIKKTTDVQPDEEIITQVANGEIRSSVQPPK